MSITNPQDWSKVEAKARQHEETAHEIMMRHSGHFDPLQLVTITTEDRLRGAVVEAMGLLEQGHQTAAWQVLNDALKIREAM